MRDFISDAAVHKKFVAFTPEAQTLVKRVLGIAKPDAGMIELSNAAAAKTFLKMCADLRFWKRK